MKVFLQIFMICFTVFGVAGVAMAAPTDEEAAEALDDESEDAAEKETSLFGDDEEDSEDSDATVFSDTEGTAYNLEINTEATVTFSNLLTGEDFLSVRYLTHIKQDITLGEKTSKVLGTAEVDVEVVGQYLSTQFFTCNLEVEVPITQIEMQTRLEVYPTDEEEEDDAPQKGELSLKVKFDKSYGEIWYSYCSGSDDSVLNTVALDAPENYNLQILDLLKPTISGLAIEDFELGQTTSFPLVMESFESEDLDTAEMVEYDGSGTVSFTPQ